MLVSPFLMKVFARLFQKAAGSKGRALGRLRRGEIASAFLVLFAPAVSKRTETISSHNIPTVYIEKILSVLFLSK